MLTIVFEVALVWVALKVLVWGFRATWGIAKILCILLIFPLLIIGIVYTGIVFLTIPAIIVIGLVFLVRILVVS